MRTEVIIVCALVGCVDEPLVVERDASTNENSFAAPEGASVDAAADRDAVGPEDGDAGADGDAAANAGARFDPLACRTSEPCTEVVDIPGDCAARTRVPCSEREASALEQRLGSCGYYASYNPLELTFDKGCATTLRFLKHSKTDQPELIDCLLKELGALNFECVDGGQLLFYIDTLALP